MKELVFKMAKMTFNKQDRNSRRTTKPIEETTISKPKEVFKTINKIQTEGKSSVKMGRPRKNKTYGTVRLQKSNVNRINAIQSTLGYETQDDLITALLDESERKMAASQKTMFEMYMKAYIKRQNK